MTTMLRRLTSIPDEFRVSGAGARADGTWLDSPAFSPGVIAPWPATPSAERPLVSSHRWRSRDGCPTTDNEA